MKLSDVLEGMLLIVSGATIYLTNYRRLDTKGKTFSRVGLAMLACGALVGFGRAMFDLAVSGR